MMINYGICGSIVDVNGVVFVQSVDCFDIIVVFSMVFGGKDFDSLVSFVGVIVVVQQFVNVIGVDFQKMYQVFIKDLMSQYVLLVKLVMFDVFIKVCVLKILWLLLQFDLVCSYLNGVVVGNLVGFVGIDGLQVGIEFQQNVCFKVINGSFSYEISVNYVCLLGSIVVIKFVVDGGIV